MDDSRYIFNNEAIGIIAIQSVIKECKAISYSKAMLILPFLLHSQTNASLRRSNTILRSSEEFIMKKLNNFGNFNSRYYSLLPITINCLLILREMYCIEFNKGVIHYRGDVKDIDLSSNSLGTRALNIVKASSRLSELLANEDDHSLYLKLRIQL